VVKLDPDAITIGATVVVPGLVRSDDVMDVATESELFIVTKPENWVEPVILIILVRVLPNLVVPLPSPFKLKKTSEPSIWKNLLEPSEAANVPYAVVIVAKLLSPILMELLVELILNILPKVTGDSPKSASFVVDIEPLILNDPVTLWTSVTILPIVTPVLVTLNSVLLPVTTVNEPVTVNPVVDMFKKPPLSIIVELPALKLEAVVANEAVPENWLVDDPVQALGTKSPPPPPPPPPVKA